MIPIESLNHSRSSTSAVLRDGKHYPPCSIYLEACLNHSVESRPPHCTPRGVNIHSALHYCVSIPFGVTDLGACTIYLCIHFAIFFTFFTFPSCYTTLLYLHGTPMMYTLLCTDSFASYALIVTTHIWPSPLYVSTYMRILQCKYYTSHSSPTVSSCRLTTVIHVQYICITHLQYTRMFLTSSFPFTCLFPTFLVYLYNYFPMLTKHTTESPHTLPSRFDFPRLGEHTHPCLTTR